MYEDEALLITYPDYPVNTDTLYGYTRQVGHAGVLLIKKNGFTKYYEFGRYDPANNGVVRNITIPNADIAASGGITKSSLKKILKILSKKSGKETRIRAARFINMNFKDMQSYATKAQPKYSTLSFNCGHYAEAVILKGNPRIDKPLIINPTPNNIVDEYIEEGNAEIRFSLATDEITIGEGNESDAKVSERERREREARAEREREEREREAREEARAERERREQQRDRAERDERERRERREREAREEARAERERRERRERREQQRDRAEREERDERERREQRDRAEREEREGRAEREREEREERAEREREEREAGVDREREERAEREREEREERAEREREEREREKRERREQEARAERERDREASTNDIDITIKKSLYDD